MRIFRSISARSSISAVLVVALTALYSRKQPAAASDQLPCHLRTAPTTPPTTSSAPAAVPMMRITRQHVSRRRRRSKTADNSRPPSSGSAGSRFTSKIPALPRKISRPVSRGITPFCVSHSDKAHKISVISGPASITLIRAVSGRRSSSSKRIIAPSGVISTSCGG